MLFYPNFNSNILLFFNVGNGWEPFQKDMHYISADNDCVWAIKTNGDVFVRTGISSQKPSGCGWITIKVASDLVQITCLNGLVWALDIYNHVQIFQGIQGYSYELN